MALLERLMVGALGTAFGFKTFAPGVAPLARVGYGLVSLDMLGSALREETERPLLIPEEREASSEVGRTPVFQREHARTMDERVELLGRQIRDGTMDPRVYRLAREVLSRRCGDDWCVKERDHRGEMEALFAEVRRRVRYTFDPTDYDAFQTPRKTLELGCGDCDDGASLLGALLRSAGHPVRLRVIATKGNEDDLIHHVYLLGGLQDGTWVPLDPTVNKPPGWEVPSRYVIEKRDYEVL